MLRANDELVGGRQPPLALMAGDHLRRVIVIVISTGFRQVILLLEVLIVRLLELSNC